MKVQLVDGSGVAFQSGGFKSADAASDNRFDSSIVPVESAEHFTTFSADDNLGKAVVVAVAAFLAIGAGLDYSPADKLFLYLQVNFLRNNGFMISFNIVLRHQAIVLNSGLVQKVCCVGLLEKGITDVFLVSENFTHGAT